MRQTDKISPVILKHFKDRPSNISMEWPVLQLKATRELRLENLFKNYENFISVDDGDGLGEVRAILFVNQNTEHWFCAYDTEHVKGVIFECQGSRREELADAYQELVSLFELDEAKQIDWVSEFLMKDKNGVYRDVPQLQRVH